ncbi:type II toxin-antitoxin system MqsR family toxin [Chlorobium phaeobacteroides]|nr:type II toxin-antitoxin system MqsR family toxin [Chlorobium phaeobacteroides]
MEKRTPHYKSMTTHHDHKLWQDVYHGMTVYIKVTDSDDDRPPVIQFKAR